MNSASNPLAENSVLSMMMREDHVRRQVFGEGITAEHFTECRRAIFSAILSLSREGRPVDPATVWAEVFKANAHDPEKTDAGTIGAIHAFAVNADNLTAWISALRDAKALRIAQDASIWLQEATDAASASFAASSALDAMKAALSGPTRAKSAKEACREFLAHLEEIFHNGEMPGISTGLDSLDIISGGMRAGELWNILGQTSRGKSVLMLQIAAHAANSGRHVAIFSAEMMTPQVFGRFISNLGPLKMDAITKPRTAGKLEKQRIASTAERIAAMRLWIDDKPKMSIEHVEAEAQRIADAHGPLDLVAVDYLQFLQTENKIRGESREREIARISGALKQLAKALNCPVLSAAQFNRQNEARESSSIEFDSDCMIGIAEDGLKVMKLRNGRRDDVLPYTLNGELQRFERN